MSEIYFSPTLIARGRAHALYYARGLYKEIAAKNLFLWAQAIAFKVLVTVVPIVILATGLAGRVLRGNDAFAAVARFIYDFLPPSQSQQVVNFLHQLQGSSSTIVGIGGVGLFLSAVSLFITLRIAVGNAFEQDWHESRTILGGYLFDVRMVLQVGILFLVTIGMSVFVQSIEGPDILAFAGLDRPWVREGWRQAIQTMGLFVPFIITTAMFFQLYYLVPKPHPRKRSAFSGALIAGVLWEMAKQIFTYYATYIGHFDRYATEGLGALGNTFALIIAFVFWVYFSGVVLMLGAVVASLREHRHVTSGLLPGERPSGVPEVSPTPSPGTPSPGMPSPGLPSPGTPGQPPADSSDEENVSPAERPQTAVAQEQTAVAQDPSPPQPANVPRTETPTEGPGEPKAVAGDGAQPGSRGQSKTQADTSPDAAPSKPPSDQPTAEETTSTEADIPSTSGSTSDDT